MAKYPIVLTIAGSDSSGGAGIQADIKTMSAIGVYAASAVTAVTAQNTLGVDGVQGIDPDMVARQIDAVFSDLRPDAVKIGMLYSRSIVEAVADRFCYWRPQNVVLDPVMISTSGSRLIEEDAVEAIKEKLFPFASLLTPNLMEAEHLTGIAIDGIAPAREAARCIVEKGCRAALVKGGHLEGNDMCDVLYCRQPSAGADVLPSGCILYSNPKIESRNLHGTGCTLSSAIATFLAGGNKLDEAVCKAKEYIGTAINRGKDMNIGHGNGPLWHFPLSE